MFFLSDSYASDLLFEETEQVFTSFAVFAESRPL